MHRSVGHQSRSNILLFYFSATASPSSAPFGGCSPMNQSSTRWRAQGVLRRNVRLDVGIWPNTKGIVILNLKPGTVYSVRIRGIGRHIGRGSGGRHDREKMMPAMPAEMELCRA